MANISEFKKAKFFQKFIIKNKIQLQKKIFSRNFAFCASFIFAKKFAKYERKFSQIFTKRFVRWIWKPILPMEYFMEKESRKNSSSLEYYWRLPWTSPWRPQILVGDPHIVNRRPHIFIGDSHIFIKDPIYS